MTKPENELPIQQLDNIPKQPAKKRKRRVVSFLKFYHGENINKNQVSIPS